MGQPLALRVEPQVRPFGFEAVSAGELEPYGLPAPDGVHPAVWGEADRAVGEEAWAAIRRAVPTNTTQVYTRQWATFEGW
jgi:hypothetical protein